MDNPIEISIEQLADLPEAAYTLVDVRDEISYNYGTMPHAVSMPDIVERAEKGELSGDRKLVLFCMHGDLSYGMTRALQALGYDLQYEEWPGIHNWEFWDAGLRRGMAWLAG